MTDMSKASLRWLIATTLILTWGCGSSSQGDLAPGAEVTIEMPDGSLVTGHVAQPAVRKPAVRKPALPKLLPAEPVPTAPLFVEVTVPAGTMLSLLLESGLASDVSQVEDPVRARIDRPVTIDGRRVIP